jgi:hypothetical protein
MELQESPDREIAVRALRDEEFREALLSEPEATLSREYGVTIPDGVRVQVHEETEDVIHLVLPGRPNRRLDQVSDRDLDDTIARMMPGDPRGLTSCCTCGSSTEQTLTSWQKGCGCA